LESERSVDGGGRDNVVVGGENQALERYVVIEVALAVWLTDYSMMYIMMQ
jgi:hypothetical protein